MARNIGPMGEAAPRRGRGGASSPEYWNRLLDLMRADPGNISYAARELGSDRKTVRRLWLVGLPGSSFAGRPMREVLAAEQAEAAARRASHDQAAASAQAGPAPAQALAARRDAITARTEEAKLVRSARANGIALLATVANLSKAALKLSQRVEQAVDADKKITAAQAMLFLARVAAIVQRGVYAAETIIALERLVLGDPSERAGAPGVADADELTDAEARDILERAHSTYERMRERGLRVVEGGSGAEPSNANAPESAPAVPDPPADLGLATSNANAANAAEETPHGDERDPEPDPGYDPA